ncbi:hypothetical protein PMAYCL1PPCAC_02771, partial [Pristionchus mayeri]
PYSSQLTMSNLPSSSRNPPSAAPANGAHRFDELMEMIRERRVDTLREMEEHVRRMREETRRTLDESRARLEAERQHFQQEARRMRDES